CATDGPFWISRLRRSVAMPSMCNTLDCKLGGLRIIQHNEVRDTIAQFMREAGLNAVELEPQLQPLDGEAFDYKSANKDDEARSDIKCCGFWSNLRQAYFDVKVVSPFAEAMHTWTLHSCTRMPNARRSESTRNVF